LEEVMEDAKKDSWAQTLQKLNLEREKQQEREIAQSGRGARRKAADIAKVTIAALFAWFNHSDSVVRPRCMSTLKDLSFLSKGRNNKLNRLMDQHILVQIEKDLMSKVIVTLAWLMMTLSILIEKRASLSATTLWTRFAILYVASVETNTAPVNAPWSKDRKIWQNTAKCSSCTLMMSPGKSG
jgi:hypothetical protein